MHRLIKGRKRTWKNKIFGITRVGPESMWMFPPEIKRGWLPFQEYEWHDPFTVFVEEMKRVCEVFTKTVVKAMLSTKEFTEAFHKLSEELKKCEIKP